MTESKYVRPEIKIDQHRLSLIFYQVYAYWVITYHHSFDLSIHRTL